MAMDQFRAAGCNSPTDRSPEDVFRRRTATGFTLIELLVAIAIIGILLGLLLPNLSAVTGTARCATQAAMIQSFGKGFFDFSTLDAEGRFCTGAYDHLRDGDLTRVGWVADLVNGKFANLTKSFDPINRFRVCEKYADAAGVKIQSNNFSGDFVHPLNARAWSSVMRIDGQQVVTGTDFSSSASNRLWADRATGSAYFGTSQTIWDEGYATNFATTWQLVRGDNLPRMVSGTLAFSSLNASPMPNGDPFKAPLDGDGPLSTAHLASSSSLSTADKIPLLGAARTSAGFSNVEDDSIDGAEANSVNSFTLNGFVGFSMLRSPIVKAGDFTVESFTMNSSGLPTVTATQSPYAVGSRIYGLAEINPNCKQKLVQHPSGTCIFAGGYSNMLFADGSCRRINDSGGYGGGMRGDGMLGPYRQSGLRADPSKGIAYNSLFLDDAASDEIRDEIWLGRIRATLQAGGM
jgi:prepilin-type N-terminal cleavage/methylation domain-containing protein/prepilin-type processing-associated H-X9-DG protein